MKMPVDRWLTVVTIIGFFVSCEGRDRMRKRVVAPAIEIDDYLNERAQHTRRELDTNGKVNKIQKLPRKRRALDSKSDKKSGKSRRNLSGSSNSKSDKKSNEEWVELILRNTIRMDGMRMSMPSSPVTSPTRRPSDDSGDSNNPAGVPSSSADDPTSGQRPGPTQDSGCDREEVLKETLQKVTDASILNDESTPQGKAYVWMLEGDEAEIDPCNYPTVEQRFALATFFYSTDGSSWENSDGWLTGSNECSWAGISCNGNGAVNELGANGVLSEF